MMRYFISLLLSLLFLSGCASSQNSIEKELTNEVTLTIYNQPVEDLVSVQKGSDIFHKFPFIDEREFEVKGKFNPKFYQSINLTYNAKSIEDVNFWRLQKEPQSLDFIYIRPLWIKEYKRVSRDLFKNIAYSLNISAKEQEILRSWVKQGGVLWVEFGLFSTRYDIFNREGEIAAWRIRKNLYRAVGGMRFLHKPVTPYLFQAKKIDLINYMPSTKSFIIDQKASLIKGIKRLKLVIYNFMEIYPLIEGKKLIVDTRGRPLVTLLPYGRGYIVSLLPFEYSDVYYDGELLRWKLLLYLIKG